VHGVEDCLQVAAVARGEDDDPQAAHARIFPQPAVK
jgi:hypothetical protein